MKTKLMTMCAVMAMLMIGSAAQATMLTFTLSEVGDDVVGTVSGAINTDALTENQINYTDSGQVHTAYGVLGVGSEHSLWKWTGFSSEASSFGSGAWYDASSNTGDYVAVNFSQLSLYTSKDYVSGSEISGTSTWNDMNFEDNMFATPGTYTMTYNGGADSIVVQVESVPEPATMSLLALGSLGLLRRRRKGA